MRLVIIESPFAGEVAKNVAYAKQCMRDCFDRGEAPLAFHLMYTQPNVLDDTDPAQREKGIETSFWWHNQADAIVVYVDLGITPGMQQAIDHANNRKAIIEYRVLPKRRESGKEVNH